MHRDHRGTRLVAVPAPSRFSDSDRLHVGYRQLLYDDGHSASWRAGAAKSQENCGVDGRTANGLDAESCMRQIYQGNDTALLLGKLPSVESPHVDYPC